MTWSDGLAVYDLHDSHEQAVAITSGHKVIRLFPGTHAVIAHKAGGGFEEINPAQAFAYRHLVEIPLAGDLRAFKSEFSLPAAMQAVMPLKQLTRTKSGQAQKLANRLTKTAAIINELSASGEQYQRFTRAPVTCCRQQ
jgi:hypothetical protein